LSLSELDVSLFKSKGIAHAREAGVFLVESSRKVFFTAEPSSIGPQAQPASTPLLSTRRHFRSTARYLSAPLPRSPSAPRTPGAARAPPSARSPKRSPGSWDPAATAHAIDMAHADTRERHQTRTYGAHSTQQSTPHRMARAFVTDLSSALPSRAVSPLRLPCCLCAASDIRAKQIILVESILVAVQSQKLMRHILERAFNLHRSARSTSRRHRGVEGTQVAFTSSSAS
jgi:hypothetical protein